MHEVSLGRVIQDYLLGHEIPDTTYEDLRQALAKMLVEDKKYPKACLRPKLALHYTVEEQPQSTLIDIAVFSEQDEPLLALFFCPGELGTFLRQSLAAARIHQPQPFALVAVTDSRDVLISSVHDGAVLGRGFNALPRWPQLAPLALAHPIAPLSAKRLRGEERIVLAYTGLGGPCCGGACTI